MIGVLGFDSRRRLGIFLFTTASRTALGPTQPPIQRVPGAHILAVKRPRRETDHSLHLVPRSRMRGVISPLPQYIFMAWCLVKPRDNFTLPLLYCITQTLAVAQLVKMFPTYMVLLYSGNKSDAVVGAGHRRQFLDWYGFRFSTTLCNMFITELRDYVVFSVVYTDLWTFDMYCAYGSAHTFSHLNYVKPSCILIYPRVCFARFRWV
jgi:hypothetical protein